MLKAIIITFLITALGIIFYYWAGRRYMLNQIKRLVEAKAEKDIKTYLQHKKKRWIDRFLELGAETYNDNYSTLPPILYRYINFDIDKYEYNQTIFADPTTFNDPFDCFIPTNYHQLNEDEKRVLYNTYAPLYFSELIDNDPDAFGNLTMRALPDDYYIDLFSQYSLKLDHIFTKRKLSNFGVLCLSERNDAVLMWSHYANQHKSICIGYKTHELIEHFFKLETLGNYNLVEVAPIHYRKDMSVTNLSDRKSVIKNIFFQKNIDWAYEREWRILLHYYHEDKRLIKLYNTAIDSIIFGCNCTPEYISRFLDKNPVQNTDIRLLKAQKPKYGYQIEIVPLGDLSDNGSN